MVDAMRAMLDELMGKERDVPLEERTGRGLKFYDPEVCKYALAGLCPYGLFKNTKSDLGPCKYELHEDDLQYEALQADWDSLPEKEQERYGYRRELLGVLVQLVRDMDRKIERQRERAAKESEPRALTPDELARLDAIKGKEKEALEKSERLAEGGDVDGSLLFAQQAEAFAAQHANLSRSLAQPERTMSVCEVCGVFINSTDNEQRRKDHLAGKQYLGWKAIREKLAEMQEREAAGAPQAGGLPPPPGPAPPGPPDGPSTSHRSRSHDREQRSRERAPNRHAERHVERGRERHSGEYREHGGEYRERHGGEYQERHGGEHRERGGDHRERGGEHRERERRHRERDRGGDWERDWERERRDGARHRSRSPHRRAGYPPGPPGGGYGPPPSWRPPPQPGPGYRQQEADHGFEAGEWREDYDERGRRGYDRRGW